MNKKTLRLLYCGEPEDFLQAVYEDETIAVDDKIVFALIFGDTEKVEELKAAVKPSEAEQFGKKECEK